MADLDLSKPLPDVAHESLRVAVIQAIANLALNITDTEDGLFLADVAFELIGSAFVQLDQTASALNALTARVAALEPPPQ